MSSMSAEMKSALDFANSIDAGLQATDTRFRRTVMIIHEEGTILTFRNAFLLKYHDKNHRDWGDCENPGDWIFIFTEHHGVHVYPIDDLVDYAQLERMDIQEIKK